MSAQAVESLLARLYTDADFLEQFLASPVATAHAMGLDDAETQGIASADPRDLRLAADSYAKKREQHGAKRRSPR